MTKREEEIKKVIDDIMLKYHYDATPASLEDMAKWCDEHPSQENIKNELIKLGYGFDLNGNIITKEQENEMLKRYCEYQKEKLIVKACETIKEILDFYKSLTYFSDQIVTYNVVGDFKRKLLEE